MQDDVWLRAMCEVMPVPINVLDLDQRIVIWNRAAHQTYGWSEADMLGEGPPFRGFVPEAYRGEWESCIGTVLTTDQPVARCMTLREDRDGRVTEVCAAMWPLHDEGGQTIGVMVIDADVTERLRFLQTTAHELRNPMASVKATTALLRRRLQPVGRGDDLQHLLQVVEGEIDRLSTVLDQVLEGFRVAAGHLELHHARFNLTDVVGAALRPFRAAEGPQRFVVEGVPRQEIPVRGDARRLEDVVRNLLSNAAKYSSPASEIRVGLHASATDAHVTVRDRGVGIPAQDMDKVFDPFYRSRMVPEQDPGGLGLGLYLCADIIRRHDGRIWLESNHDGGVTAHFTLPLATKGTDA